MRRPQSGQALVAMLALLAAMLGGFALLFNSGQVVNDKIRLTNAADAAAYSAAQWEARSLNFQAYLNRAMVANEVAIAQLVSLRSWSRYVGSLTTNIDRVARYVPYLGPPMRALERGWDGVDRVLDTTLPPLEGGLSRWNADVLASVQAIAHLQAPLAAADLVPQVLAGNEPRARLSDITRLLQVRNGDVWRRFTQRYERGGGDLRRYTRLLADSRDGFTRARSDDLLDFGFLSLARRGGTDLIGEYAWRGVDTLSLHIDYVFDHDEIPLAWGAAEQRRDVLVSGRGDHGGSLRRNPSGSRRARRALVPKRGYQGLPQIRDVSNPASQGPRPLVYSVAAHLPQESIRTLDRLLMTWGLPTIEGGSEPVAPALSAQSLHAIASAEVYFQRPAARRDGRTEFASLFNPYWQARLVPVSATERQLTASSRGLTIDPFAVLP
jgi:Flp pilus assembly protein TadG